MSKDYEYELIKVPGGNIDDVKVSWAIKVSQNKLGQWDKFYNELKENNGK